MFCEQTAGPISANICPHMHAHKVRSSADFIQIVDELDHYFKGHRFESSTFRCSNVIISQTVADRPLLSPTN